MYGMLLLCDSLQIFVIAFLCCHDVLKFLESFTSFVTYVLEMRIYIHTYDIEIHTQLTSEQFASTPSVPVIV